MSTPAQRPTCTAPALPTTQDYTRALWVACGPLRALESTEPGCPAATAPTCQGTDWPPMTAWQRYAEDRRLGQRVPPSVSTWRPQDIRRQQEADALARGQAPQRTAVVLPWGPGPSCEGHDR